MALRRLPNYVPPIYPEVDNTDAGAVRANPNLPDFTPSALRSSTIPEPTPAPMPTGDGIVTGGNLGRGVASGWHGALANIQAYGSAMARQMGYGALADNWQASALRRGELANSMAPTVATTDDIHGVGDAVNYAAGAVGQAAGSLVPIAAGAALLRSPGAFATMVPMSGGEVIRRDAMAPTGAAPDQVLRTATTHGALSAALGMAPLASIVGRGPLARVVSPGAGPAGAFFTRAGATMLGEGAQEGVEEYTAQQAMRHLRGEALGPADDPRAIKESTIAGAVGMAPFGAVHGASGAARDSAAEARRLAAETAGKVTQSPLVQAAKEVGEHVSGVTKDEFGKREGVAGAAVSAEAAGRRIYDDLPAMGARLKEGVQEQGYVDRFSEVHEHAQKLAGKGFTEEELGSAPVMEAHGKDVQDMVSRLRGREDLSPEDQDALDLFDKERGAEAPGRASLKHVRQPVAKAFLRAMERDRTAEIDKRMELVGKKFAGTKKSLSPTGESAIDRLLADAGFMPPEYEPRTSGPRLAQARGDSYNKALKAAKAAAPEAGAGKAEGRPRTVRASSVADRAIWAMFDADYRDPDTVDRLSGHVDDLVRRIAHGEADAEQSVQAERALVSMASTPQAANQLRELFAKARELSTLDLNKKDQRKAFVKELSELVTSKRLPYTEALAEFAKAAGNDPKEVLPFVQRFEKLMIRDDTRPRAEAEVQRMFGADNFGKALRLLNFLVGPPESFAPTGANREAHNRPGLTIDERAPHLRDDEPDANDPDAMASYLGYETREEDPETRGFGVVSPEEVTGKSFVQEDAVPMSPHAPFRVPAGLPQRMSGVEAFRHRLGKDAGTGQLITRSVMDAVNEAQFDATERGEEYDRKGTLQRYYNAVRASEEQDAAAAREFLAAKGESTGKSLRSVDPDVVIPKIRAALAAENRKDGNPDFPETRDEARILSKVRVDREMKEIEKYAGGDPEVAAALASIYRNEKHRSFGDQYGPAEFFETYSHRLPGKRGHNEARAEKLDRAIEAHLYPAEEARPEKGTIGLEVRTEDSTERAYRVLDLPAYLAERVRADAKVVHRENLQGALASLILHLDQSDKYQLTDKAKATLGLDGKGRINRDLLLFEDGKTKITGRDFSGLPMETPDSTPFRERYTEKDLAISKGMVNRERGDLRVGDGQRVNLPQEVSKAAQMHGATAANIQRLNKAQIAGLLDRVLGALEKRFPNDFDRGALPAGLVLARRKQWDGTVKQLTMADFKEYGLDITPSAREAGPEMKAMEFSAEPQKTSELNLQSYLDMLLSRLSKAREDLQKPAGERAKERFGPSERNQMDSDIRDMQGEIAGLESILRTRKSEKAVELIAKRKAELSGLIQRRTEQLAADLKIDETRAKMAAAESDKEYENRDVMDGPWADVEDIGEFFLKNSPDKLRLPRVKNDPDFTESDENAVRSEKDVNRFPSKNLSDIVGIARSVSERLDSIRFGKEFDLSEVPAEPITVTGEIEGAHGKVTKQVTLSGAEEGKLESRLTDEEPPTVYHDPKAVPKAKPLPAEAYAEYEASKAPKEVETTQSVAAKLEDDLSKMRVLIEKKSLSPVQVTKQIEQMNVDVSVIDAFMRELPEGPYGRALRKQLDALVDKKTSDDVLFSRSATDERGSQDDFGDDYKKEQFDRGLEDHIRRFGETDKANAKYRELRGKSGSYNPTTGELIISATTTSVGQAWAHENIHHLFKKMREVGGEAGKVIQTLITASDKNEAVLKKARELLVKDLSEEDAKALLADFDSDPEERAAYLYQLRVAGLIGSINPPAEGAIKRIFRWLHDKLGFLSDEQKAENFLKAWEAGQLKGEYKNPSALARAMGQESRLAKGYEVVSNGIKPIAKAVSNAFTPSYDRVIELKNPALTKVAEMFGRRTPGEDGRQGYYWEREKLRMGMENRISAAIEGVEPKDLTPAIEELLTGEPKSELAVKLKGLLGEHIPDVTDREEVSSRFDEWLADVKIEGPKSPGAVQRALSGDKIEDYFGGQGQLPAFSYLAPEKRVKWQIKDPAEWLSGAIRQLAAKQAREEVLGKDAEKLKALLKEAREKYYATDDDMSVVKKFVAGTEGWLGADMPPALQKLQVATTSALNVFLLPVAIMSTLMDPIYIGVRSGDMTEAWQAYGEGLKSFVDTFMNKGGKLNSEAAKFAEDVNLIAQAGMTEPIADLFNGVGVTGTIKKVNKAFFRFNLMQGWEQAMFAASAMAAKRSILHHSTLPDPKWSKVFLEELGLKKEDIKTAANGDLAVFEHDGLTPEQARKIQSAIHAFSFQAAARPSAMSNSIWMNDRYYALLAHMKPFTMAQAAGVLDWVEKRANAQDYTPALRILPAVPVALAAEAAKSVLTGGTMANSPWEAFKKAYMQAGLEGRWIFADRLFSGLMNNQGLYAFTNLAPVTSVAGNVLRGG